MYYVQIISTYRLISKYLSFQIIAQVLQNKTLIFFIKTELLQWKLVYTFIQKFDFKIEVKIILQRTTWTFTKNVLESEFLLKWKCWRIIHYLFQSPKKMHPFIQWRVLISKFYRQTQLKISLYFTFKFKIIIS